MVRRNSPQLTRDQSLVAQRVSAGFLTEEEARRHPERNVLLQALGVTDSVEVGLSRVTLYPGDIVLLCSDGLHGLMSSDEVYGTIAKSSGLEDACQRLVGLANSRGGPDNITAVIAQFLPARSMGFYGAIEQEDDYSLFDNDRHVLAAGVGVALPWHQGHLKIDAGLQEHLLVSRDQEKAAAKVPPCTVLSHSTGGSLFVAALGLTWEY